MGTWAIDSFGNDDAADLLGDLTEQSDLAPVREAIARVLESDGYVEAPDAQQCLAACEVLAVALNRPSSAARAEEELMAWIARVKPAPDAAIVSQAANAIDRVLAHGSELRELWEESEEFADWQADVVGLRARLQA